MKKTNLSKYTCWFHDGDLIFVDYDSDKNELKLTMTSCEIPDDEDEFDRGLPLSKKNTIAGILHLENIEEKNNEIKSLKKLTSDYDSAEIKELNIENKRVEIGILWTNYTSELGEFDYCFYFFEAKNIWWENIPHLGDEW